ncbi:M14 family metallocarboxypeptidase [uncultured Clostridium sp.]|uniref:M14 family metallopeptidase n=1 Tax=uncultured Clostridium sp. TaxID=59620 RepID=UPI00261681EC|nr:M14 family metallocarboxypeptidase [uncultured Clostridium sp.]
MIDILKSTYTYDKMTQDLQELKQIYKNDIIINSIGKSLDNRDIYEIILGKINNKNHVLVHAGIHGREYLTSLLIIKQIEYYLNNYESGEYCKVNYKDLFDSVTFHLIPMANPDGITISQLGINTIQSENLRNIIYECYYNDLNSRHTCDRFKNYLKKWKANARGVDLNRNFDAGWDEINQRKKPSFQNYKGVSCNSEPETKALVNLVNKYNFAYTISYHSSGDLIYWDYRDSLVKNESSKLADIISYVTGYEKEKSDSEYEEVVPGGFKDWASSKSNNPIPSITIEVGIGNCPLKNSEFKSIWNANCNVLAAIAYMLE